MTKDKEEVLLSCATKLWDLLDDIERYDDVFKKDFEAFNRLVMDTVQKRHDYMKSDGYDLEVVDSTHPAVKGSKL